MPSERSTPIVFQYAHDLRHNATEAETKLWTYLRSHRLINIHFRRQHPIGKYIVDFCAIRQKLIIEIDGSQHLNQEEQDGERSSFLSLKGYGILRFWNNDVMNNLEAVIVAIEQALGEAENK